MKEFLYLAFDPGGTTGWASLRFKIDDEYNVEGRPEWKTGQIGPHQHHGELWTMLWDLNDKPDEFFLITESFEYRNRARAGLVLDSVEYIGVMKLFCAITREDLYKQTAAMGKGFVKDENIKKLGLWSPGNKHAMDAMRHLIYFIVMNKDVPALLRDEVLQRGFK